MKSAALWMCLPCLVLGGCFGDSAKYPFIGTWELQSKSGPRSDVCNYLKSVTITENTIATPFVKQLITDVRKEGDGWIVVTDQGTKGPPAVFKNVTSSSMSMEGLGREFSCEFKKAG